MKIPETRPGNGIDNPIPEWIKNDADGAQAGDLRRRIRQRNSITITDCNNPSMIKKIMMMIYTTIIAKIISKNIKIPINVYMLI